MGALTVESLKTILNREVQEVVLTVAKSSVFGMDSVAIAEALGVEKGEIDDLMGTDDYKDVRLLVGAEHQKEKVERDSGWDGIETSALTKLARRVTIESDTETLLKIAAVANKAQRRTNPPKEMTPLDAGSAGQRIPLQLTKRYTEKLLAGQVIERSETQQISILNGSAVNPSFDEVQAELSQAAEQGVNRDASPPKQAQVGATSAGSLTAKAATLANTLAKGFIDGDQL